MAAIVHVGIVGAGLAGLAAALAVARAGARVDVFEVQPSLPALAVHLEVVPNLLRDLVRLGVAEACVSRGFPYQGFAVLDGDGRAHFELPTPRLAGAQWPAALGMVYGDLLSVLAEAATAAGARLHFGHAATASLDGPAIVAADGQRHRVDLALVADGRAAPAMQVDVMPQRWCHALLPRPTGLEQASWVVGASGLKVMLVPVDTRRVGVAVLLKNDAPAEAHAVRAALEAQGSLLRRLAAQWGQAGAPVVRPVRSGLLAPPWHEHGVLRIGASAHVLPPHFGQSAAQSVEDALVLGDLLGQGLPRDALLEAFAERRAERARGVHAVTTQAARWDLRPDADTDLRALVERLARLVARSP